MLYTLLTIGQAQGREPIKELLIMHAFEPAEETILVWGWIAPWSVDVFRTFFKAARMSQGAY